MSDETKTIKGTIKYLDERETKTKPVRIYHTIKFEGEEGRGVSVWEKKLLDGIEKGMTVEIDCIENDYGKKAVAIRVAKDQPEAGRQESSRAMGQQQVRTTSPEDRQSIQRAVALKEANAMACAMIAVGNLSVKPPTVEWTLAVAAQYEAYLVHGQVGGQPKPDKYHCLTDERPQTADDKDMLKMLGKHLAEDDAESVTECLSQAWGKTSKQLTHGESQFLIRVLEHKLKDPAVDIVAEFAPLVKQRQERVKGEDEHNPDPDDEPVDDEQ